jgi:hypothetical protein
MTTTTLDPDVTPAVERGPVPSPVPDDTPSWSAALVTATSDGTIDLARRAATGLALASLYGVALGARQGGRALAEHALGVPLGIVLVVLLGAPSLFVFLSLCRAPMDGQAIARTAVRGIASAGVVLAGLAPAAALFVVSSETPQAAAAVVTLGLLLGGGVALGRMVWEVTRGALRGQLKSSFGGLAIAIGFAIFAVCLATRVWGAVLPILGGAS